MARKKEEPEEVEQQQDDEEGFEEAEEESGISINITEDTITVDLPRDGNEGETLTQLAKMVEGLG
jgi:hypothetical protein